MLKLNCCALLVGTSLPDDDHAAVIDDEFLPRDDRLMFVMKDLHSQFAELLHKATDLILFRIPSEVPQLLVTFSSQDFEDAACQSIPDGDFGLVS